MRITAAHRTLWIIEIIWTYYNRMELMREPLLAGPPKPPNKKCIAADMTPIERYNLVINCYNLPCNIIDNQTLQTIP